MKRFLGIKLSDGTIRIEGSELNHMKNVIRCKKGDKVIVSIGDMYDYVCEIEQFDKTQATLQILEQHICEALPKKQITLLLAMPKREYFETILTKAVELGCCEVVPFITHYSVNHSFKQERVEQIVATACKQSEQSRMLIVQPILSFQDMLKSLPIYEVVIFANEHEMQPFDTRLLTELPRHRNIAVIVGSEGGFDTLETDAICKAGAVSVSLGKRILRCDTAATAMLTLVSVMSGN